MKIINKLYKGEVELVFESTKHQYFTNGKLVPGCTTVLGVIGKPFLVPWAAKVTVEAMAELFQPGISYDEIQIQQMLETAKKSHYQKKTDAGAIGTLVHRWLEQYIMGENPPMIVHEEARKAAERFLDWVKKDKVTFRLNEQQVFSRKMNVCGTLDFVCEIDGKLWLGDIKTSNAIYKTEYGAQMSCYRMCRTEEYPEEKYAGEILVRVGKQDGEFEIWKIEGNEMDKYDELFINALNLYNSIKKVDA